VSRAGEVAITITAVSYDVFPFLLRSADRADEEAEQVDGVLRVRMARPRARPASHSRA
jgi:hypothetical protein